MTFIDSSGWTLIGGGLAGQSHLKQGQGSQDALHGRRFDGGVVAVVCDGCSAGRGTAVGAGLGARFVAAHVARLAGAGVGIDELPARTIEGLTAELKRLSHGWADDDEERAAVIADALVFTVVAAVVVGDDYIVFGVGDGRVRINGADIDIGGCTDAAPDAPAYALIPGLEDHSVVHVHATGRAADVHTVLIGSDGAGELDDDVVSALEHDQALTTNPSLLTKRLAAAGPRWDDCTLMIVRRGSPEAVCA
jgi:hypothetical protein